LIVPDAFPLKLLEGLALLGALIANAWWQLRGVRRAQQHSARARSMFDRQAPDNEPKDAQ
jgi:hypothetical protein